MNKTFKNAVTAVAAAAPVALMSIPARAEIDVSAVVSVIGTGVAAVTAIGVAVLSVWGTKKVFGLIAR